MVPQDPMLLQGTIRMNLDPAQEHTDEDLWKAIDKAHIRDLLNTDESKALLWKRKIVILDEATANIDTQTDQLMQSIIRKEFAECTVLTIAHRLKTVIDSDRIMVLDQGKIVEFDTPDSLLAADGQFSKLVQSMEFNESTLK
ncbi:Multidrug resistance-associated protein 1 [Coemansia sp. RSA 2611]|nr:Multidrug resistance-associated protein 1 [Coemansia sp. RSA 2611]